MVIYGMQSTALLPPTKFHALVWRNLVGLIQRYLTKASVGQNMDNPAGHQPAALPRFWMQQGQK